MPTRFGPRLSREFSSTDKLGIFLQLYNLKLDETSHKTNVSVVYRITKEQQEVWRAVETPDHLHQGGEQLTIERYLPVVSLPPGRYTIEVIAVDLLANETVTRTTEFTLKPAQRAKPGEASRPSPTTACCELSHRQVPDGTRARELAAFPAAGFEEFPFEDLPPIPKTPSVCRFRACYFAK